MSDSVRLLGLATLVATGACSTDAEPLRDSEFPRVPEAQFAEVNGARLQFLDWGGGGELLLVLPGLGATAHHFDDLAPELARDFRVVVLTRRGHGESEKPTAAYDLEVLTADVVAFLDYLEAERTILAAHSLGSLEAVEVARRYPDRISSLILLDAAYDWPTWLGETAHLSSLEPPDSAFASYEALDRWYREVQSSNWGTARAMDLRGRYAQGPTGGLELRMSDDVSEKILGIASEWTAESFAGLAVPTLAVWANQREWERLLALAGQPDSVVDAQRNWRESVDIPAKMRAIEALRAAAPSVEVVEMDAVHELHLQVPQEVARVMRAFLAGSSR